MQIWFYGHRRKATPARSGDGDMGNPVAALTCTLAACATPFGDGRRIVVATQRAPRRRAAAIAVIDGEPPFFGETPDGRPGVVGEGWCAIPASAIDPRNFFGRWYALAGDPRRADPAVLACVMADAEGAIVADIEKEDDPAAIRRAEDWRRLLRILGLRVVVSPLRPRAPAIVRALVTGGRGVHIVLPESPRTVRRFDVADLAALLGRVHGWGLPVPTSAATLIGSIAEGMRAAFVRDRDGIPRPAGMLEAIRGFTARLGLRGPIPRASREDLLTALRAFAQRTTDRPVIYADDGRWEMLSLPLPSRRGPVVTDGRLYDRPPAERFQVREVDFTGWYAAGRAVVAPGALPFLCGIAVDALSRMPWRNADDVFVLSFAVGLASAPPEPVGLTLRVDAMPVGWARVLRVLPETRTIGPKW